MRLKRFVEIQPADSLPFEQILGYAALIKGLFYSEESLRAIEEALGVEGHVAHDRGAWPLTADDVGAAITQIQLLGFDGQVYGKDLSTWGQLLFDLAHVALSEDERAYLESLQAFAAEKQWWKPIARIGMTGGRRP